MIASLTGVVTAVGAESAVVEVGGIGLAVNLTPANAADLRVGEPVRLATSLVVREDSLTLFGFADDDARRAFDLLQSVGGIGPRLAQAVLAVHTPDGLRRAVASEDLSALCRVPGIGRKSAQRLVLELKDKLAAAPGATAPATVVLPDQSHGWRDALRSALSGLGWAPREVEDALQSVAPEAETEIAEGRRPDVAALLRECLRGLNRV